MTLIILLVVMTAVAMALLLGPFLKEQQASVRTAFDLQVFEDQLLELQRDLGSRLIDEEQAEAARVEIKRRILTISDERLEPTGDAAAAVNSTTVPVALALIVPVFCSLLYLALGAPEMPGYPLAARAAVPATQMAASVSPATSVFPTTPAFQPTDEQRAEILALPQAEQDQQINDMVDGLEQRLKTSTPNDLDGWMMLGRSRNVLGDRPAAAAAYQKALTLLSPSDPRRRDIEVSLAAVGGQALPAGQNPIAEAAVASAPPKQPTPDQRAEIAALPADQQNDAIRTMVDGLTGRLKENPHDLNGWMMLARSRTVLGEPDAANAAYRRVLALLAPDDPRRADIEASITGAEDQAKNGK